MQTDNYLQNFSFIDSVQVWSNSSPRVNPLIFENIFYKNNDLVIIYLITKLLFLLVSCFKK